MSRRNWYWLTGGLMLLAIFIFLDPFLFPFPKCPFRMMTGWLCPGCGSQRAIYHVLHGDLAESFRVNMLFLPALVYGASAFLISTMSPGHWPEVRRKFFGQHAAWIAFAVIISFWILRNI